MTTRKHVIACLLCGLCFVGPSWSQQPQPTRNWHLWNSEHSRCDPSSALLVHSPEEQDSNACKAPASIRRLASLAKNPATCLQRRLAFMHLAVISRDGMKIYGLPVVRYAEVFRKAYAYKNPVPQPGELR